MSVRAGVESDLEAIAKQSKHLAAGALAESARAMADLIDDPNTSAHAKSLCQGRMQEALKEIRALAPPEVKNDGIDDLQQRRADRIADRGAATEAL